MSSEKTKRGADLGVGNAHQPGPIGAIPPKAGPKPAPRTPIRKKVPPSKKRG